MHQHIAIKPAAGKKYLWLLAFLITAASCRVSLVPAYSDAIVTQIENTAKMSDRLLLQVQEADEPGRAYKNYADKYVDVQVELQDLLRKEQNRSKAQELITITNNITEQFIKYKEVHRTRDTKITDATLTLQRQYLNDQFIILLAAEKSLPANK